MLSTGISDSSDATFLTADSSENATFAGNLTVSGNLTVTGTTTQVDTVTMNAQNAVLFEGATADAHETTLTTVDPTGDRTISLPNVSGTLPVLAAASATAITSTPAELNLLDGSSANSVVNSKAVIYGSSGELAGTLSTAAQTNITSVGTLSALTISGATNLDGAIQVDNTLTVGVDDTGHDVKFFGATAGRYALWNQSNDSLDLMDSVYLRLGTGGDLNIFHNGTDSSIMNNTGDTYLRNDNNTYITNAATNKNSIAADPDNGVSLYFNNSAKLSTVTTGAQIAGMLGINVTANTGHSNSTGSIQISGSNDNYQAGAFNESSMLSLDATNSEGRYAAIRFSHGGGTEGHFGLVRRSATSDITDFVWQGYDGGANAYKEYMRLKFNGNLGINSGYSGTTSVSSDLTAYSALSVQTGASNGDVATNSAFAHFGPLNTASGANTDGYISGVSFGYCESNNNYRHTAIAARAHGDGAARRDMVFLVNGTSEAASAALGDAKLTISSGNGVVSGDLNDTSDLGFKENVADLGNTLSIVNQLKPRTFKWKDERAARGDSVGFIAQEVKSVVSDNTLVQGEEYDPDNLKMTGLSLNTVGLVAYLTKAIQELSQKIADDDAVISALETRIETIEQRLI